MCLIGIRPCVPSPAQYKPDTVTHACNPNTGGKRIRSRLSLATQGVRGQPGLKTLNHVPSPDPFPQLRQSLNHLPTPKSGEAHHSGLRGREHYNWLLNFAPPQQGSNKVQSSLTAPDPKPHKHIQINAKEGPAPAAVQTPRSSPSQRGHPHQRSRTR